MLSRTLYVPRSGRSGFVASRFGLVRLSLGGWPWKSWSELFPAHAALRGRWAGRWLHFYRYLYAMLCYAMQHCFSFWASQNRIGGADTGWAKDWHGWDGTEREGLGAVYLSVYFFRGKNGYGKEGKTDRQKAEVQTFALHVCVQTQGLGVGDCEQFMRTGNCIYGFVSCCLACDVVVVVVVVVLSLSLSLSWSSLQKLLRIKSTRYQIPGISAKYQHHHQHNKMPMRSPDGGSAVEVIARNAASEPLASREFVHPSPTKRAARGTRVP